MHTEAAVLPTDAARTHGDRLSSVTCVGEGTGTRWAYALALAAALAACGPLPEPQAESTDEIEAGLRDTARPRSSTDARTTDVALDVTAAVTVDVTVDAPGDTRADVSRPDPPTRPHRPTRTSHDRTTPERSPA